MKGDTGALKHSFGEGLASPVEVSSSRELSLVAVCNAPVDDGSYDHAWEYAYRNSYSITELKGLECIMTNTTVHRDWREEQNFFPVHEIVFGRSSKLLKTELDEIRAPYLPRCETCGRRGTIKHYLALFPDLHDQRQTLINATKTSDTSRWLHEPVRRSARGDGRQQSSSSFSTPHPQPRLP
ncbi:hypothetical protein EJ05DRAFT_515575 [Pseudovirgaria hyperparasitica]|uniref:Uncharacterized protein n=1 Tax=Pseudovirgaria hyperparasitica TaxID=470096 RepID=A0A6A6VPI4_9PEZI|nr:uncharacterized protein EJ05DRAFT_515575 [Pseudovirgaria hyperparasitica]KAF2752538.1 hypothetical protein EJ05DRAFT_515575 [Pseudovirgaria hyperparasitica]